MNLMISIPAAGTFRLLTLSVIVLIVASFLGQAVHLLADDYLTGTRTFAAFFDVDGEKNIPTYFASFALLSCSVLLAGIASFKKSANSRFILHWSALSIIFLLLSLDETVGFHELTIAPLRSALDAEGFLYYTWVVPGIAFLFVFVLSYLRFFINLPADIRRLFLFAGVLYVAGAVGGELVSGRHADLYGTENMMYVTLVTIEEFLEMMGVLVFIYTLMSYMASHVNVIGLFFAQTNAVTTGKAIDVEREVRGFQVPAGEPVPGQVEVPVGPMPG